MKDFLLDENYRPLIENGDFVTGDDLQQRQRLLLATNKGEWKENPLIGVGIEDFLNDENISGLMSEIKRQLRADGQKVNSVYTSNNQIIIDAENS